MSIIQCMCVVHTQSDDDDDDDDDDVSSQYGDNCTTEKITLQHVQSNEK